jgi:hypothetical protein
MKKLVKMVTYTVTVNGQLLEKLNSGKESNEIIKPNRLKIEARLSPERYLEITRENFKTIFGEDSKTKVRKGKVNYKINLILK